MPSFGLRMDSKLKAQLDAVGFDPETRADVEAHLESHLATLDPEEREQVQAKAVEKLAALAPTPVTMESLRVMEQALARPLLATLAGSSLVEAVGDGAIILAAVKAAQEAAQKTLQDALWSSWRAWFLREAVRDLAEYYRGGWSSGCVFTILGRAGWEKLRLLAPGLPDLTEAGEMLLEGDPNPKARSKEDRERTAEEKAQTRLGKLLSVEGAPGRSVRSVNTVDAIVDDEKDAQPYPEIVDGELAGEWPAPPWKTDGEVSFLELVGWVPSEDGKAQASTWPTVLERRKPRIRRVWKR